MYLLDQTERHVLAQRQVAALAGMELPDVGAAQAQLLSLLEAEPDYVDPDKQDLLIALGLRR